MENFEAGGCCIGVVCAWRPERESSKKHTMNRYGAIGTIRGNVVRGTMRRTQYTKIK